MNYWKGNTMRNAHFNTQDRSIKEVLFEDDKGRRVVLNVSHYAPRRRYLVSLHRAIVSNGFVTTRIMEDSLVSYHVPTPRYSEKKLQEVFDEAYDLTKETIEHLGGFEVIVAEIPVKD